MRKTYSKTDVDKMLVEERKAMRSKAAQSAFLRRTLSIYNGMKARQAEERGVKDLSFTLEEFRAWADTAIRQGCYYCGSKLTVKKFAPDHAQSIASGGSFDLPNLRGSCQQCNWRKGKFHATTFKSLQSWAVINCDDAERADLWRRLSLGGKWAGRL